ncbi:zeaxanthin epoxidase, chloroplastic [Impatiens glandulifera]|uniref:zeaxanthin epoxidase, chloroplastic n=1 Tax=Impatiens glandulifera TaxID=253017 RepID=UPI001FB146C7|nr:zeaxanthin epoxidase, chloroplastic [Impatiens glandulifera]
MEISSSAHCSFSCTKPQSYSSASLFHSSKPFSHTQKSVSSISYGFFSGNSKWVRIKTTKRMIFGPIQSSRAEISSKAEIGVKWILEPAGDGDWRHIGNKVSMPDAFEIASNVVTIGRVAERADIVIPVATVSGLHARIQKKGGSLFVTDLDSTNGTFIDEKRLRPGIAYLLASGSYVIFGDTHLALFRAKKLKIAEALRKPEEVEVEAEVKAEVETETVKVSSNEAESAS